MQNHTMVRLDLIVKKSLRKPFDLQCRLCANNSDEFRIPSKVA